MTLTHLFIRKAKHFNPLIKHMKFVTKMSGYNVIADKEVFHAHKVKESDLLYSLIDEKKWQEVVEMIEVYFFWRSFILLILNPI